MSFIIFFAISEENAGPRQEKNASNKSKMIVYIIKKTLRQR